MRLAAVLATCVVVLVGCGNEVKCHNIQGFGGPLAGRDPDRTSSSTLTPLRNAAGVKGYPQLRLANPAGLPP
jgi:hypothetical protein